MSDGHEMLPECKVHFETNAREHKEIKATMERHQAALFIKLDAIEAHIRNGMTSKIASQGAMIKVMWTIIGMMILGLFTVAWRSF